MAVLRSGTTIGGSVAWHAGNDGANSGLDADLLDGKHASDFSVASHRHGFAGDVPAGTSCVVTHNLGTRDVVGEVYQKGSPYKTVQCEVARTSTAAVTLVFSSAVAAGALRCLVTKV